MRRIRIIDGSGQDLVRTGTVANVLIPPNHLILRWLGGIIICRAGRGGLLPPHPPFTAPAVSPATIWRWAKTVSTRTGSVTISAAAASGPQLSWSNEIML